MVYPCVYREHKNSIRPPKMYPGLSLCIQGTRYGRIDSEIAERFIPVYTGNTLLYAALTKSVSVYPCVYREHPLEIFEQWCSIGLSLCIQGTLWEFMHLYLFRRFIPVYTGNTPFLAKIFPLSSVYPCVYREHSKYI